MLFFEQCCWLFDCFYPN